MIRFLLNSINEFLIFFDRSYSDVGPLELIKESGIHKYRYKSEDIKTICLIKTARTISSLNAIMILFRNGFFLEIGALLRGIKESNVEMVFLLENYPTDSNSKDQEQYIREFFAEEIIDPSDPINSARKHTRVPAKKIHAAAARVYYNMSDFISDPKLKEKIKKSANPSDTQKTTQKIQNMFSGYVHFGYSQSMDMIGVPPKYLLNGMLGTPRVTEWYDTLLTEFDALYNLFQLLCFKFGYKDESIALYHRQQKFRKISGL